MVATKRLGRRSPVANRFLLVHPQILYLLGVASFPVSAVLCLFVLAVPINGDAAVATAFSVQRSVLARGVRRLLGRPLGPLLYDLGYIESLHCCCCCSRQCPELERGLADLPSLLNVTHNKNKNVFWSVLYQGRRHRIINAEVYLWVMLQYRRIFAVPEAFCIITLIGLSPTSAWDPSSGKQLLI